MMSKINIEDYISKQDLKIALDNAYNDAGPNAYFRNGFNAGIKLGISLVLQEETKNEFKK